MNETKLRFGITVESYLESDFGEDTNRWSFGVCLSHWGEETYLYINLFKWSICVGRMRLPVKECAK